MRKLNRQLVCVGASIALAGAGSLASVSTANAYPPASPTITNVVPGGTSVSLNWVGVAGAHNYFISNGSRVASVPGSQVGHTWAGLKANTKYCFRVRAVNDGGEFGKWSPSKCTTTKKKSSLTEVTGVSTPAINRAVGLCLASAGQAKLVDVFHSVLKKPHGIYTTFRVLMEVKRSGRTFQEVGTIVFREKVPLGSCFVQ